MRCSGDTETESFIVWIKNKIRNWGVANVKQGKVFSSFRNIV